MTPLVVSKPNPKGFNFGNDIAEVDVSAVDVELDHESLLVVGTAGDLAVDTAAGNTVTIPSAVVSAFNGVIPVFFTKVYNAGTTAADIWAIKP